MDATGRDWHVCSLNFLQAIAEARRAPDADPMGREPAIELVDVDVKDLAILGSAVWIGRPDKRSQRLGVDTGITPYQVEDPCLDRRQRDVGRKDGQVGQWATAEEVMWPLARRIARRASAIALPRYVLAEKPFSVRVAAQRWRCGFDTARKKLLFSIGDYVRL